MNREELEKYTNLFLCNIVRKLSNMEKRKCNKFNFAHRNAFKDNFIEYIIKHYKPEYNFFENQEHNYIHQNIRPTTRKRINI